MPHPLKLKTMTKKIYFLVLSLFMTGTVCADNHIHQAPQVPTYNEITLPSGVSTGYFRGSLVFADINADGNMDLLVKGRDLNNGWNPDVFAILTGSDGTFTGTQALSNDGQSWERTLTAFDYNNDGLVDYLLANSGYELYKNNGDETFSKVEKFSLDSNLSISDDNGNTERWYMGITAAADFNLDGFTDLIVMDGDGNPTLYLNECGTGSFKRSESSGLCPQRGGTMAVGDFNRDGYPDLVVTGWNDDFGNHCIKVNKNNGDGTFTTVSSDNFVGTEKGQILFVDADGDGYLDVFVTGESCPEGWAKVAYLFHNNGDETFLKVSTSLPGMCKGGADWIDLNGDGLLDLVYVGEMDNGNQTVVAINQGSLSFAAQEGLLASARGGAAVATYDINRNGFPDIAIMGYNDNGQHFHVFNGLCSRNSNTSPSAPTGLSMTYDGAKTTFSWSAASDKQTPPEALRYNVFVKFTDGTVATVVPADPETGKLRLGDVNAALTTCSYTISVDASKVTQWGVQAIDGGKYASTFAIQVPDPTGIGNVSENLPEVAVKGNTVLVSMNAFLTVRDISGRALVSQTVLAHSPYTLSLPKGLYLFEVNAEQGGKVVRKMRLISE